MQKKCYTPFVFVTNTFSDVTICFLVVWLSCCLVVLLFGCLVVSAQPKGAVSKYHVCHCQFGCKIMRFSILFVIFQLADAKDYLLLQGQ